MLSSMLGDALVQYLLELALVLFNVVLYVNSVWIWSQYPSQLAVVLCVCGAPTSHVYTLTALALQSSCFPSITQE
jgi:hypothetical protein